MKDFDLVHFYPTEEIFEKAKAIFESEKTHLKELIPEADIQQVGSSAIPGALGKFDIDIQIRISGELFKSVEVIMQQYYQEKHKERLWNEDLMVFLSKEENSEKIDYMVTVIDSPYDDYYRVRDYFINNPEALADYNAFKMHYEGKPYHEYRTAKGAYLGGNGSVRFLDY